MKAFRAAVIALELGLLIAAFCGFLIAASDNIAARRKAQEQVRAYNESIKEMKATAARLRKTQGEMR